MLLRSGGARPAVSHPRSAPIAVVTGGAIRLGRQLCTALAARGYDLVILYRNSADAARELERQITASGRQARARVVDVGVETQVAEVFAEIARQEGRVDLLVNNVGNYNPQHITRLDPAVWDATLAANLSGAYYCCFHALRLMPSSGNIINIGMAGLEGARANVLGADYFVSKIGLLALTRSLAAAYAERNIRVNMVSPGQLDNSVDLPPPDEIGRTVPLGRAGALDEVAQAVAYLLDAAYVTGANIDVAGGYRL
ncbi:MAG: SDR family oxidoreductase [Alphaproteobacteria bacterium]|nr:SDR family oxidoreductase [Alphaproteobacteria bacterium]